jgi:hypothetical protein
MCETLVVAYRQLDRCSECKLEYPARSSGEKRSEFRHAIIFHPAELLYAVGWRRSANFMLQSGELTLSSAHKYLSLKNSDSTTGYGGHIIRNRKFIPCRQ